MFKGCVKREEQTLYIPRVSLMILTMFRSLDGGFVSGLFSSAFNLFVWLFNSNSILRNPAQYRRIPNAETVVAKEGKCRFWLVIFVMQVSLSLAHLRTCYVSLLPGTVIFASHLEGKDQIGFCICLPVASYALLRVCFLMQGGLRLDPLL